MAAAASDKQGRLRRTFKAIGTRLQALDFTGTDYLIERIERLEREVASLKEELAHSRLSASSQ